MRAAISAKIGILPINAARYVGTRLCRGFANGPSYPREVVGRQRRFRNALPAGPLRRRRVSRRRYLSSTRAIVVRSSRLGDGELKFLRQVPTRYGIAAWPRKIRRFFLAREFAACTSVDLAQCAAGITIPGRNAECTMINVRARTRCPAVRHGARLS